MEIRDGKRYLVKDAFKEKMFDRAQDIQDMTLRELALELDVNHSTLKTWKYQRRSVPGQVFRELLGLSCLKSYRDLSSKIEEKSVNWGQKRGGRTTCSKFSEEEMYERLKKARQEKSGVSIRQINFDEDFLELLGIFFGYGCLSKFYSSTDEAMIHESVLTGHSENDRQYFEEKVIPLLKEVFDTEPKPREAKNEKAIRIHSRSKKVFKGLSLFGMPIGKKIPGLQLKEPVLERPWSQQKNIVRGLFDTDGNLSARKDEGYKYPYIMVTSRSNKLRDQLKEILRAQSYPAYIHNEMVVVRGMENTKRWMEEIGTSHPVTNKRFRNWLDTGKLLPKFAMGR